MGVCHSQAGAPLVRRLESIYSVKKRAISIANTDTPHNSYPIKCILLDKSHEFEEAEHFAFSTSLTLFMVGIISAPYFPGTHFPGPLQNGHGL